MSFVLTKNNVDYTLYLVTDQKILSGKSLEEAVEQAIFGGCSIVQLREKDTDGRVFFETAKRLREMTAKFSIPLIINDRVDIAMAVGADGVQEVAVMAHRDDHAGEVQKEILQPVDGFDV